MTKLFIYNYGLTEIASFKNSYEAFVCLKHFNELLIKAHGCLPENIFYFTIDNKQSITIFYETNFDWNTADQRKALIKELYYNRYENAFFHNSKKVT